jgi:hypothetical protein
MAGIYPLRSAHLGAPSEWPTGARNWRLKDLTDETLSLLRAPVFPCEEVLPSFHMSAPRALEEHLQG